MKRNLTPSIAWRYLLSEKSHVAVGAISAVAIIGIAIATAAIICVLSVFNGFQASIAERLDAVSPDIIVTPKKGKTIPDGEKTAQLIASTKGVAYASPTITDNALAIAGTSEMPVTLKGVNLKEYKRIVNLDSLVMPELEYDSIDVCSFISIGAASGLHAYPSDNILIFAPKRHGRVNLSNPASSFITDSIRADRIFRTNQKRFDENLIITDFKTAQRLFECNTEASAIEIKIKPDADPSKTAAAISAAIGDFYSVKDRLQQQEMDFRMIKIEKWITFLLLFLILVIASFNLISSLSMLVIEKEGSLQTLRAIGMSRKKIGSIFFWESIFVTVIGGATGIVLGVTLSLLQQHFGLIKIGGDPEAVIMDTYPVVVDPTDIFFTMIPIALIGFATAAITSSYARSKARKF